MAKDMVNLNHKNIQESILKLYSVLGDLIKDYPNKIEEIKFSREKMYKNGKNVLQKLKEEQAFRLAPLLK